MIRKIAAAALVLATMTTSAVNAQTARTPAVTKVDDGYLLGNPKAPISIVIVSSFTCPHCGDLEEAAMPELKRDWVSTGKASVRFVPYVMFPTDLPAVIAGDCGQTSGFFRRSSSLFANQSRMASGWAAVPAAEKDRLQKAGKAEQTAGLMKASGIPTRTAALGITSGELGKCMTDTRMRDVIRTRQALADKRYAPQGTPTVYVNGKPTGTGASWPRLQQVLMQTASRR